MPVEDCPGQPRGLRILSLACAYPNPREPNLGIFVSARLRAIAARGEVVVIAPVPLLRYSSAFPWWIGAAAGIPGLRQDGSIEVRHPRWFYLPFGGALNSFFLFLRLAPMLARLRRTYPFQLLDAQFGHPDAGAAALLSTWLGVPFTATLRGSEVLHARSRVRRWMMRWALRRAARVIAVSTRLREFAISLGVEASRISVVPNGVDARVFRPRDRSACRRRHNLALEDRIILSAGNLIELKGHHRVIRALAALRKQNLAVTLVIAGSSHDFAYQRDLHELAGRLDLRRHVRFAGQVPQEVLAELMCAADVLCLASSSEGCPNVVSEALACGTPVVAHDIGALPQMLPSETLGFIVPAGDQVALEASLARALWSGWDREAIARWGQSRSWEQVSSEVLAVFHEVVGQPVECAG